ncbi:hypothetical protein E2C01_014219 [Portunus trituberculatus]|uniref:Uncharacterized protein n=1 Tax=Portunus trituberculatus TaxID=210409 RepID=A0A5B7DI74_PORTR|nr:hypothetical protein [Portunus trituberculatus]
MVSVTRPNLATRPAGTRRPRVAKQSRVARHRGGIAGGMAADYISGSSAAGISALQFSLS